MATRRMFGRSGPVAGEVAQACILHGIHKKVSKAYEDSRAPIKEAFLRLVARNADLIRTTVYATIDVSSGTVSFFVNPSTPEEHAEAVSVDNVCRMKLSKVAEHVKHVPETYRLSITAPEGLGTLRNYQRAGGSDLGL